MHPDHIKKDKYRPDWFRAGIISAFCFCIILIAALAWYTTRIYGSAITNVQTNSTVQGTYLNSLGQRVQVQLAATSTKK